MVISIFISIFVCLVLAALSQWLIQLILGKQWLISFIVVFGFSIQELIRGYFQIRISALVAASKENLVKRLSLLLIVFSTILSFFGVKMVGLIGVPIGIAITYGILIILSYKNKVGLSK